VYNKNKIISFVLLIKIKKVKRPNITAQLYFMQAREYYDKRRIISKGGSSASKGSK
jgi:hypothetical protein